MCGIAGYALARSARSEGAVELIRQMTDRMRLRGPDAEGIWIGEGIALGHRRLAILDLEARANQPMHSNDGRYVIVFNGEIYNFRELRAELEAKGHAFRTTSDTEVLLELYALEGTGMLRRLRGMFALAIWDTHTRDLLLARDPYGIKPLYYTHTSDGVLFASQVKALKATGLTSSDQEPAALAGFYLWGSVPEPWTLYRGVFALPAGHWLRVRDGIPGLPTPWHDIRQHWQNGEVEGSRVEAGRSSEELEVRVRQAVTASVRAHLVADVPICVFLSGGIDSTVIAGRASELGAQVQGITIGFREFADRQEDEVPTAATVAAHFGFSHYIHHVTRDEFEEDLPGILAAMDQPSIDGVNTWFASKAAAERGYKVVLSGVGGDELFCGYPSFRQIPRSAALGRLLAGIPGLRPLLNASCTLLAAKRSHPKLAGLPTYMHSIEGMYFLKRCLFLPTELPSLMGTEAAAEGLARLGGSPPGLPSIGALQGVAAVSLLESTSYLRNQLLRDSDWASMAHSLELRTPLVDASLLEQLGADVPRFTAGVGKALLARTPLRPLPRFVVDRPKSGFSIPIDQWLAHASLQRGPTAAPGGSPMPWARRWARTVLEAE